MSSTDLLVLGMCALMIVAGITMIRLSRRQRGMGAIGIVIGVIGLLAYLSAEEGAPPPVGTPSVAETSTPEPAGTP